MTSLEERMEQETQRKKLMSLLNGVDLYTKIMRRCHYHRIGIQVLNNGSEYFAYTSFNDQQGRITTVEKGLHNPDITASVEENVLQEILERSEELQQHPLSAALHYAGKFSIKPHSAYWKIMKALV